MKIKIKGDAIEDNVSIEGLFDCTLKHEIKKTSGSIIWTGPKIPPEVWQQVLAFFKWTYDTTKSESQVRLFVSPTLKTWRAYAFPQEAKTGMTAVELANDEAKKQRAALDMNPPDWFLFGTVHHHCSTRAFQSGTDKANEEGQDGLHITIGKMNDDKEYDLHARFYRKGLCFTPDMSWFYDVTTILSQCPAAFRQLLPKNLEDVTAKKLMCTPAPADTEIPEQWKNNLIEIKPPTSITPTVYQGQHHQHTYFHGGGSANVPAHFSAESEPLWKRTQNAWKEILYKAVKDEILPEDIEAAIGDMSLPGFAPHAVLMSCLHHKIDATDLERTKPSDLSKELVEEALQQEHEKNAAAGKAKTKGKDTASPGADAQELKNAIDEENAWRDYHGM